MLLDFNETCILNETLTTNDRDAYFEQLEALRKNTPREELRNSIDSLIEKLSCLTDESFQQVVNDRNAQKIFTYPPYRIG